MITIQNLAELVWKHAMTGFHTDDRAGALRAIEGELAARECNALTRDRQWIVDEIYRKFVGGGSGDPTAVEIIDLIRRRSELASDRVLLDRIEKIVSRRTGGPVGTLATAIACDVLEVIHGRS